MRGFPKLRSPFLGSSSSILVSVLGPSIYGNPHVGYCKGLNVPSKIPNSYSIMVYLKHKSNDIGNSSGLM